MIPSRKDLDGRTLQGRYFGNRYANDAGGNHIGRLRDAIASSKPPVTPGMHNTRFCEIGQHRVANDGTKAVKPWACAECRGKK